MHVKFVSDDLIHEVKEDIYLFGKEFKVFAVYSWYPEFDKEFITDYVHGERPTRDEALDEKDFQELIANHEKGLQTLEKTKHKKMTLEELLELLEEQNKIIQGAIIIKDYQKRAIDKYNKKLDKKVKQRYQAKSRARTFIRKMATRDELLELQGMINSRLGELKDKD